MHSKLLCILLSTITLTGFGQPSFQVVPLGVKGGVDESNLSAYSLSVAGTNEYVCLDAGTVHAGIQKAIERKTWKGDATSFLRKNKQGPRCIPLLQRRVDDKFQPVLCLHPRPSLPRQRH